MNKCTVKNCENEVYEIPEELDWYLCYENKCILHCKKPIYKYQIENEGGIYEKYENKYTEMYDDFTVLFNEYFKDKVENKSSKIIYIEDCCFPARPCKRKDDCIQNNIIKLQSLGFEKLQFTNCKFSGYMNELNTARIICATKQTKYISCEFYGHKWDYAPFAGRSNADDLIEIAFQWCYFLGNLEIVILNILSRSPYTKFYFLNTFICNSLKIEGRKTENNLELCFQQGTLIFNDVQIENCHFTDRFFLNNQKKINNIEIKDCTFREKFEFKQNSIQGNTKIYNCNFSKIADFYNTNFNSFEVLRTNFDDITVFERCSFKKDIADFTHVTFKNYTTFRDTCFLEGLDLSRANFISEANFLDIAIEKAKKSHKNTKRETFRIIKHSFDRVGNYIEGNKYYAEEMIKMKKGCASKLPMRETIIFKVNDLVSNFGQSWIRPILLIVFFLFIYYVITSNLVVNLIKSYSSVSSTISFIDSMINRTPFLSHIANVGGNHRYALVNLVFSIIFAILTWQLIVAVKRKVRR